MITVSITKSGGKELARIEIENVTGEAEDTGQYALRFSVATGTGYAVYQRSIDTFFRRRYNVLALLRLALDTLDEKELTLDASPDSEDARRSPGVAGRLEGPL